MAMFIKKGDLVVVTAGKDKGTKGKVLRALPGSLAVVVEGVNQKRRRVRARRAKEKGQTVERALPIPVANVSLWCEACGRGRRVGFLQAGGQKTRICKKCQASI